MKNQKVFLLVALFLAIGFSSFAQVQTPRHIATGANSGGFYEYLPEGYNPSGSQTYPLIIFVHGIGELGQGNAQDLPRLLNCWYALPKRIQDGQFPISFTVGGQTHKFIVLSPQFKQWPSSADVNNVLTYALQNYKVNVSRVYVTGLSMGGGTTFEFASDYASKVAAIVPTCGASWPSSDRAQAIANGGVAVWGTHNQFDGTVSSSNTIGYVDQITAFGGVAKKSIWPVGGHDSWTKTYDPTFTENGLNIYQWMLQYQKGSITPPALTTYALPGRVEAERYATMSGIQTENTQDVGGGLNVGWIDLGDWMEYSVNPSTAGTYTVQFRVASPNNGAKLHIKNQSGTILKTVDLPNTGGYQNWQTTTTTVALASDTQKLRIESAAPIPWNFNWMDYSLGAPNQAPAVNAGADQSITLPVNSVTLTGTASDPDGSIASYQWVKLSGGAATITSPSSASTSVTGLVQGTYRFKLTATDNQGATASDTVQITVNAAPNQPPTANAGMDQTITLPTNSVNLSGSAVDADGTITAYLWTKLSGGQATITSPTSASTSVTSLLQGVYLFKFTATDNNRASASDTVQITVNAAPQSSIPNANSMASYVPYNGKYGYGLNPGWYGYNWSTQQILELGSGGPNAPGIGAKTARMQIYDNFINQYGINSLLPDYQKLVQLGYKDITVMVGGVSEQNKWNPFNITTVWNGVTYDDGKMFKGMYEPIWNADGSINANNTYAKYLHEVVLTYGQYVKFWEVWNEPDFTYGDGGWKGDTEPPTPGSWFDREPTPEELVNLRTTVPYYVRLLRISWEVIKKYYPNSYVCTGGIGARSFLDAILRNTDNPTNGSVSSTYPLKGGAYFDVLSFHTYPEFMLRHWNIDPAVTPAADGFLYYRHSDSAISKHLLIKNRMDNLLNQYSYNGSIHPRKHFICTETGMSRHSNIASGGSDFGSNDVQRNYMLKAHVKTQVDGQIKQTYWYTTADGDGSNPHWDAFGCYNWFGNTTPWNATRTDQGLAMKTMSDMLYGKSYDAARTNALNLPATVDGAAFKDSAGNYIYVLWARTNTDLSETASAVYNFPSSVLSGGIIKKKEWNFSQTAIVSTLPNGVALNGTPAFFEILPAPPSNQAPTANAGPDQAITLPTNSVVLNGSGTDPDGTVISYHWSQIAGPSSASLNSTSQSIVTAGNLVQGVYRFELIVTDNLGATGKDTVIITVNPAANQAPTVNAGADQSITLHVNSVTLTGTASDPDGSIASYQWVKLSGGAATITSPSSLSTTVTGLVQGTYSFKLTVTDNQGATASDTVQITVNAAANQPPTVNAGANQTITLPQNSVTLTGTASDPDGTIASYNWTKISGGQATITSPTSASTSVTNLTVGTYIFRLTVTDNQGASAFSDVEVKVNRAPNQAPSANAGIDQTITLPVNSTTLTGIGTDPDGTVATVAWTKVSGGTAQIVSVNAASTLITGLSQGSYVFRFTVTDNEGAVSFDDVTVTVMPAPNMPPVANAGIDQTITLPLSKVLLEGEGTDPDGTITSYTWSFIDGPVRHTVHTPSLRKTIASDLVEGTYRFKLTVTDNSGASSSDTVVIKVKPAPKTSSSASLYPNPASSVIQLKIDAATAKNYTLIRIYNAVGVIVHEENFLRTQHSQIKEIDVSHLQNGSYVISFMADVNTPISLKFIKQ